MRLFVLFRVIKLQFIKRADKKAKANIFKV